MIFYKRQTPKCWIYEVPIVEIWNLVTICLIKIMCFAWNIDEHTYNVVKYNNNGYLR